MSIQRLQEKFFSDPDWAEVENMLAEYIAPLVDPKNLDFSQNATQFKAELKAKHKLYEQISQFLANTKIISRPLNEVKKNIFK